MEETIKYEFTKKEVETLWDMIDICLKAGGLRNLMRMSEMAHTLQKPVEQSLKDNK